MNEVFLNTMSILASKMVSEMACVQDDPTAKRGLSNLLMTLCRNMEDVAPRNVSIRAMERGRELGINDLRTLHFDDGGRINGGRAMSKLHWEHWFPVVEMRKEIVSLGHPTPEACKGVLSRARVCWILKEEDLALTALGYRCRRPDPEAAYREAGILMAYSW